MLAKINGEDAISTCFRSHDHDGRLLHGRVCGLRHPHAYVHVYVSCKYHCMSSVIMISFNFQLSDYC
jgi:hypothetical protein